MERVVRIGFAFNYAALALYLYRFCFLLFSQGWDETVLTILLVDAWSVVVCVRFLLALRKHRRWGLNVAYNWGFFLAVAQFVAYQLSPLKSAFGYAAFAVVIGQLLIIYLPNRAILFTLLLTCMYGIRLVSAHEYSLLILVIGLLGLGIVFRASLCLLIMEIETQRELFHKARWAASELTEVLLHLDTSLESARASERQQMQRSLAREIHDSVGYMMTALIVQIGVVRELSESALIKDRLGELETMARATLRGIRQEVSDLRSRPTRKTRVERVYDRITQLCAVFSECTGVEIQLNVREDLRSRLDDAIGEPLYRIVQEALTNSYRHGSASLVDITIRTEAAKGLLLIQVSDNGKGCKQVEHGNGLKGIYERTLSIGGSMDINTAPGKGFDIGIDIPFAGGFQS